jgi:hypothetical protein
LRYADVVVMIVLVVRHLAASGEVARHVTCERCGARFDYRLARSAAIDTVPLPSLVRRAEEICRERLARRLAKDVEPVACPSCGWMQSEMVDELRRRCVGGLRALGIVFAIASAALSMVFVSLGIWFRFYPIKLDIDCWGIAAAGAAGSGLGLMMIGLRALLGRLRYGAHRYGRCAAVEDSAR